MSTIPATIPSVELSSDQAVAFAAMEEWAENPQGDFTLGGLAGTGKSLLLSLLVKKLDRRCRVLAPTGRAAQVVRRNGVPASTIHSEIYTYNGTYTNEQTGKEFISWLDREVDGPPGVYLVDEASMVSADIADDLRAIGPRIGWIGDHGQLPPIGRDPCLLLYPRARLEKIHRQAEGSAILAMAHAARHGVAPQVGDGGAVRVMRQGALGAMVDHWLAEGVDQVACAYNATRRGINLRWRLALSRRLPVVPGERLVCLLNDRSRGVYNGTMMVVDEIEAETPKGWAVKVTDDGGEKRAFNVWKGALAGAEWKSEDKPTDHVAVDYAYAITVHKAQGGQWNYFAVVDQPSRSWDVARWRYTAFSRAKEKLLVHV